MLESVYKAAFKSLPSHPFKLCIKWSLLVYNINIDLLCMPCYPAPEILYIQLLWLYRALRSILFSSLSYSVR